MAKNTGCGIAAACAKQIMRAYINLIEDARAHIRGHGNWMGGEDETSRGRSAPTRSD